MGLKLIFVLGMINILCFSSTQTLVNEENSTIGGKPLRLVLRNPVPNTSLVELVSYLRQKILEEIRNQNSGDLETWTNDRIADPVRRHLEEHPEIRVLLEEKTRIELSLDSNLTTSDINPIVMIIDRWSNQTAEEAVISAILYPASVPMQGDECNYRDPRHLIRLALSASYGNSLAYHHLALWAHMNRPDTYGLPRDRELSPEEVLYRLAFKQFELLASNLESGALNNFQRRTLLLCMRDLKPGTRSYSAFEISTTDENEDPRLLFNIGISGKNNKEALAKSKMRGFLKAGFHSTRYIKDKVLRTQELQRLKASLIINEKRSRSMAVGDDLFERVDAEVSKDLAKLEDKHIEKKARNVEPVANLSSEQISGISQTILEIINKN